MRKAPSSLITILSVLLGWALWAQTPADLIAEARTLVQEKNDYAAAEARLNQAGQQDARAASEAFTEIGVLEYNRRNFRNAYAAFRAAIRLQPTNQTATQYFTRMRREMDVNNLKNEYVPPQPTPAAQPAQTLPATSGTTAQAPSPPVSQPSPADGAGTPASASTPAEQPRTTAELQALAAQLKAAEERLAAAQTSVTASQRENETLRRQLESQRQLVERMLAQQANQRPTVVQAPAQNNAQIAEALRLLAEAAQRPVVVETDPAVKELLQEIRADRAIPTALNPFSPPMLWLTLLIGLVLLSLLVFLGLFVIALIRARQPRQPTEYKGSYGIIPVGLENNPASVFLPPNVNRGLPESPSETSSSDSLENQRLLLRADHLQKMYDDARSGKLSWDTIRRYVDDLDKSLRHDILKVVETKLETGGLLVSNAALSVIFPFLTDFDSYLSAKAEELAKRVLTQPRGPRSTQEGEDLFSTSALSLIPKKLAEVTKKMDRSLITAQLSYGIAKRIGLSESESEQIYKGALAHDAGYLMLDANKLQRILAKPEISDEDWKYLQSHVEKGIEYFNGATIPPVIRDAILYHHERNDGTGYPHGLKKEEIPTVAKIVGLAETFAALISPRVYRDRHEVNQALAIIRDGARRKFDAELVGALEEVVRINGGWE